MHKANKSTRFGASGIGVLVLSETLKISVNLKFYRNKRSFSQVVTCHVSVVTFDMSHVFFFFKKKISQSGETIWWRVCYPRGYPV